MENKDKEEIIGFWNTKEVLAHFKIKCANTLYLRVKRGSFPKPMKLSGTRQIFLLKDLVNWELENFGKSSVLDTIRHEQNQPKQQVAITPITSWTYKY